MASKNARSGGKFTGNHTSMVPAAVLVADIADQCRVVTKISPGFIKTGLRSVKGRRRVKIVDEGSRLLITVRDNISQQELHVYTCDSAEAVRMIAAGVTALGMQVSQM